MLFLITCNDDNTDDRTLLDEENLIVLEGASVFDSNTGSFNIDKVVILAGQNILEIGSLNEFRFPKSVTIYDARGKFIIPGLIDMHSHIANISVKSDILAKYLASGVTTVRLTGTDNYQGVLDMIQLVETSTIDGPRLITAGRIINAAGEREDFGGVIVSSEAEMRQEIQTQAAAGVAIIKLYWDIGPDLLEVAIDEAHANGLKVMGHQRKTSWTQAAQLGIDYLTHSAADGPAWELVDNEEIKQRLRDQDPPRDAYPDLTPADYYALLSESINLDGNGMNAMIEALLTGDVTVDPTLVTMQTLYFGDDTEVLAKLSPECSPKSITNRWGTGWESRNPFLDRKANCDFASGKALMPIAMSIIKKLHENGVRITAGSDYVMPWITPGDGLHRELELLVESGIPPNEVLVIATKNAAEGLEIDMETGAIEKGKLADLVVLNANPVEDITNTKSIEMVFKQGYLYEPDSILSALGVTNCN
jgi:imidazolonepropionase-like amidohydrolase